MGANKYALKKNVNQINISTIINSSLKIIRMLKLIFLI